MKKRIITGLMACLMVLAVVIAIPVMDATPISEPDVDGVYEFTINYDDGKPSATLSHYVEDFAKSQYFTVRYDVADENGTWLGEHDDIFPKKEYAKNIGNRPDNILSSDEWKTVASFAQKSANRFDITFTFQLVPKEIYDENEWAEPTPIKVIISPSEEPIPEPTVIPNPTPTPVINQSKPVDNAATLAPKIQVDGKSMSVQHSIITVTINGIPTELDAIVLTESNGGAHTYYKLRDVGEKVGFDVDWTPETGITVSTD